MAYATVLLERPQTGQIRVGEVGTSWWMFVLGPLIPMMRSDWKHTLISLVVAFVTAGLSWFVYPFFYNLWHLRGLLLEGYKVTELVGIDLEKLTQVVGMPVKTAPNSLKQEDADTDPVGNREQVEEEPQTLSTKAQAESTDNGQAEPKKSWLRRSFEFVVGLVVIVGLGVAVLSSIEEGRLSELKRTDTEAYIQEMKQKSEEDYLEALQELDPPRFEKEFAQIKMENAGPRNAALENRRRSNCSDGRVSHVYHKAQNYIKETDRNHLVFPAASEVKHRINREVSGYDCRFYLNFTAQSRVADLDNGGYFWRYVPVHVWVSVKTTYEIKLTTEYDFETDLDW